VLPLGFLGDGDLRGEPEVPVSRGEAGDQAAAAERGQRLDRVPHRAPGLAHGKDATTPPGAVQWPLCVSMVPGWLS